MKLKIAVVVGPENAGKSWVLKSLVQEMSLYEIDNFMIRPVAWPESEDLKPFGFEVKRHPIGAKRDWGIGWRLGGDDVTISDWNVLKNRSKDIFASGILNGRKVLIASEGDYLWSWLLNLKYLYDVFGTIGDDDEVLMFCACQVNCKKDVYYFVERGYRFCDCGAITMACAENRSFDVRLFSLFDRDEQQPSVLSSLKTLLSQWSGICVKSL